MYSYYAIDFLNVIFQNSLLQISIGTMPSTYKYDTLFRQHQFYNIWKYIAQKLVIITNLFLLDPKKFRTSHTCRYKICGETIRQWRMALREQEH